MLAGQGWQIWKLFWLPLLGLWPHGMFIHCFYSSQTDASEGIDPSAACSGEAHHSWLLSDNLMLGSVPVCGLLSCDVPGKVSWKGHCIVLVLAVSWGSHA